MQKITSELIERVMNKLGDLTSTTLDIAMQKMPRAMFCLFCTGKCAWGLAWFLRRSARQTKGTVVRLW